MEQARSRPRHNRTRHKIIFGVETVWFSGAQVEEVERWMHERELWMGPGQAAFNLKPAVKFNRSTRRERRGKHLAGWCDTQALTHSVIGCAMSGVLKSFWLG